MTVIRNTKQFKVTSLYKLIGLSLDYFLPTIKGGQVGPRKANNKIIIVALHLLKKDVIFSCFASQIASYSKF